jgi:2-polyprenyl-3-methyl-5-hydroxy-6-metoxy-1,4-benzoquinol methylase
LCGKAGEEAMSEILTQLQQVIDKYVDGAGSVRLLEAGCGSISKVRLGSSVSVTGIDISPMQLARNENLSEKILGDLQTYQFPDQCFDIIICWDVLEHLERPDRALDRFFRATKPGGLIILAYPNLYSLKGIATKITPHIADIWYYRYLLHRPDAGTNDTAPFVTFLRNSATYPAIRKMAKARRFQEILFGLRESLSMQYVRTHFQVFNFTMKAASAASRALTLGKVDLIQSDCIQVLKAPL